MKIRYLEHLLTIKSETPNKVCPEPVSASASAHRPRLGGRMLAGAPGSPFTTPGNDLLIHSLHSPKKGEEGLDPRLLIMKRQEGGFDSYQRSPRKSGEAPGLLFVVAKYRGS